MDDWKDAQGVLSVLISFANLKNTTTLWAANPHTCLLQTIVGWRLNGISNFCIFQWSSDKISRIPYIIISSVKLRSYVSDDCAQESSSLLLCTQLSPHACIDSCDESNNNWSVSVSVCLSLHRLSVYGSSPLFIMLKLSLIRMISCLIDDLVSSIFRVLYIQYAWSTTTLMLKW